MRSISIARAWMAHLRDPTGPPGLGPGRRPRGPLEALEPRWVPSTGGTARRPSAPAVQMISATTTDSQSVTIEYQVNQPVTAATPLQFGVYRSSRRPVRRERLRWSTRSRWSPRRVSGQAPTLDQAGQSATAVGTHTLTIALPGACRRSRRSRMSWSSPTRARPPRRPTRSRPASFRVYTIGIVTHGGIQDPSWTHGPPWELETAYMMRHEGFDSVIAYNWALQSSTPGEAIKQSPRLARIILGTANRFPANSVVDLELIGHSEGTVVNTYALATLQSEMTPSAQGRLHRGHPARPPRRQQRRRLRQADELRRGARRAGQDDRHELPGRGEGPAALLPLDRRPGQCLLRALPGHGRRDLQPLGPGARQERGPRGALLQPDGHGSDPLGQDRRELLVPGFHRAHAGRPGPAGAAAPAFNGQIDGAQTSTSPSPSPTAPACRRRSSRPISRSSRARPRPARWCGSSSAPPTSPARSAWPA